MDDAEIRELQERLREAEDTLKAIRSGQVDALVVGGDRAPEVFTLEGGTEAYRVFMEQMEIGAAALDLEHRVVYANQMFCALLGRTAEDLQSMTLPAALPKEAADAVEGALHKGRGGKQTVEIHLERDALDGHLLVTAAPLSLGPSDGLAVTFTDITERVRAAADEESERLSRAVLQSANQAMVVCDREGVISHANAAALALCGGDVVGRRFHDAVPLALPEMPGAMQGDDIVAMAIGGTSIQGLEAAAPDTLRATDLLVSAAPLIVAGQRIRGCVITLADLTQRKAAERQQQLLMRELDHRVKNTLTLVLSICSRTAAREQTIADFQKAIAGRIQALAATHNLLADKSWSDVQLDDLVRAELAPYLGTAGVQTILWGLDVSVSARAATALGLIFHELATNAVKYGALSRPGGRLRVAAEPLGEAPALTLLWEETGGPPVGEVGRKGFGQTVIARSLAYDPEGGATVEFRPQGVVCTIKIPRQDLPTA